MIKLDLNNIYKNLFPPKIIIGIDEAGRGPIAGPLVFTGVIFDYTKINFSDSRFTSITDSKKLSAKQRENLFNYIKSISLFYKIVLKTNTEIDKFGISYCIKDSITRIINSTKNFIENYQDLYHENLNNENELLYIFDGKFKPINLDNFYTFIKADFLIKEVSAASIISKVIRDRIMISYSKIYKNYEFNKHKGYGTKKHIQLIQKYGYCPIHRKSFIVKQINTLF